jgi:hypothetical protein
VQSGVEELPHLKGLDLIGIRVPEVTAFEAIVHVVKENPHIKSVKHRFPATHFDHEDAQQFERLRGKELKMYSAANRAYRALFQMLTALHRT